MLKKVKATTPSQRNLIKISNKILRKSPLLKTKINGFKNSAGKNNTGKTVSYHKGGGHKRNYRNIDFCKQTNAIGIVTSIEYDPNRTANIASIYDFLQHNYFYILAPKNLTIGDIIKTGPNAEVFLGHTLPISKIPEGSFIYNISPKIGNNSAEICRSAGTFATIIEKTADYCLIKLPSGLLKKISTKCYASIGIVSNELHSLTTLSKAGRSRWLNKRPTVRGVAMNPIDHPHGGGEGKKSGKNLSPWGKSNNRGKTCKIKN